LQIIESRHLYLKNPEIGDKGLHKKREQDNDNIANSNKANHVKH
jgi:hypothetical protein